MAQASDPTQSLKSPPAGSQPHSSLPRHIAIIMDGNNRWIKQRGGSGLAGHRAGAESVRTIIRLCAEKHIECLTLFAFSSENWQRPEQEVSGLMSLFARFLQKKEVGELHRNGIKLGFIGNRSRFSSELQGLMRDAEQLTANNQGLCVTIAADYGGRWDITQAARELAMQVKAGTLAPDKIDEAALHRHTALAHLPPPDLCIRTGGEFRISNFLLWQFAYTELHFTPTFWPDFGADDLDMALADFASRQRRYGKVSEQVEHEREQARERAMLKQRVITGVLLASLAFAAIVWFPPEWFQVFIALFIAVGTWEWSALAGLKSLPGRLVFTAVCVALMFAMLHVPADVREGLFLAGALWWIVALVFVCRYPNGANAWHRTGVLLPLGLIVLLPGWLALVALRGLEDHAFYILLLIGLIVAADSGAYFPGRAFGKHKLALHVSPNKTWEGFFGGQFAACLVLWIALFVRGAQLDATQWLLATIGTLLIASASVVGDLFESMLKRQAGVKDSGSLLPGHGGVLDRIDSLTAALPVYAVLLMQAGIL